MANERQPNVKEQINFLVDWLRTAEVTTDKELVGSAHNDLGDRYSVVGQYDKAIHHHKISLSIAEQRGDKAGEGSAYEKLGICFLALGQCDKAIKHHEMHLKISEETRNMLGEERANACLGMCYVSLSQYDKAIKHNQMCLNIAKQIKDVAGEGTAYGNLGNCSFALGQFDEAMKQHEKCRSIARQIGDKAGEGTALGNLGNCYLSLGQSDKAINCHKASLNIAQQIGYVTGKERAYGNLGNCYRLLGQYDKAIKHHDMVLEIAEHIGDKAGEEKAHGNIGNCYIFLGNYEKAIEHLETCQNIARQLGDLAGEGTALGNLGICHKMLGQYHKAIKRYEMNVNIAKQIGDKAGEGKAHGNLGNCYSSLGQYDKAIEHHEISLEVVKQTGQKEDEGATYTNLSSCYYAFGKYDKAEQYCRKSVQCYENLFVNVPKQDQFKVSILDTFINTYQLLIRVLLLQNKEEEALVIAERGRSKALTDLMLTNKPVRWAVTEAKALDLHEICEVGKALNSTVLFFTLMHEICTWIIQPIGDVLFKKNGFAVSPQARKHHSTDDFVSRVEDLDLLVDKVTALILSRCIVSCEDRSLSFLYPEEVSKKANSRPRFVLRSAAMPAHSPTPDLPVSQPDLSQDRVPVSVATITAGEEMPRSASAKPTETKHASHQMGLEESNLNRALKELYQIVLAPVRQFVEGTQVVIVPDGRLSLVPFAALVDEKGRYLAETLRVRLVPSLGTVKMIMDHSQELKGKTSPLIVGNPDVGKIKMGERIIPVPRLPHANKEAEEIGRLLNVQPLTADQATKETFLQKVESANLIHIAAHGDVERGEILLAPNPGIDKIPEKENVMLTISDLEDKHLRAKLVVLSCCHSGRGEVRAEGVIGIARAFLGAGASAVLVTLWAIDDEATFFFMVKFYEQLIHGESKQGT